MNAMHVRSHNEPAKVTISHSMEPDITVVEHGGPVQQDLKDQNGQGRGAKKDHQS